MEKNKVVHSVIIKVKIPGSTTQHFFLSHENLGRSLICSAVFDHLKMKIMVMILINGSIKFFK